MSKLKILVFIDWYLPGYKAGGPIQSVANIISQLNTDFDFKVITSDTDLNETQPYSTIKSNAWNTLNDGTQVYYFSKKQQSYRNLKRLMLSETFDIIYTNSLFSKFFTIFPLLIAKFNFKKCKLIVAPRGMLGEGALQLKAQKKKYFINAAKIAGIYANVTWHASTSLEADEIKNVFGADAKVVVALNLSKSRLIKPVSRIKEVGKLKLVFVSRISPKKNLLAVSRYLAAMDSRVQIEFDYYGPIDDKIYFEQCAKGFSMLPANVKATYMGAIEPLLITTTLSNYHFSILPTLNENFGHSIVESWVAGCPVIISDQTPWKNLEQQKVGWDITLQNEDAFINTLKKCCQMQQNEFDEWSNAAYRFSEQIINNADAITQNKNLFSI